MATTAELLAWPSTWPYVENRFGPQPAVPVKLWGPRHGGGATIAYVDSGAPRSAIPTEFAETLGVDLEIAEGKHAFAAGEYVEYRVALEPIHMEVAGRTIRLIEPIFAPFEQVLLGRDVFQHFRVTIDERAQHVILDPYPEEG